MNGFFPLFLVVVLLNWYPAQILLLQFLSNAVLNACIVRVVFVSEAVDVEYIVPKIMFSLDVLIEVFILLVCLRTGHSADEA